MKQKNHDKPTHSLSKNNSQCDLKRGAYNAIFGVKSKKN